MYMYYEDLPEYVFRFKKNLHIYFTALLRKPSEINQRAADMWSFAVLLWELETREVPHADLTPMECGMKVKSNFC